MTPTSTKDKIIAWLLTPFSWLYGTAINIRNFLFDKHFIRAVEFDVPVVCVGNLTVGGTGKTPHVEYIVSQLRSRYNIAIVSRGYKRETKGFVLANSKSTPETIGDEPYQMYQKFGSFAKVAVCEKRSEAIQRLLDEFPEIDLVILDDAFQHRYIKPKVSVLLMDYNRPVNKDSLLPLGRLREPPEARYRAEILCITKCPTDQTQLNYRLWTKDVSPKPYQDLYFTNYEYQPLRPVFPEDSPYRVELESLTREDSMLLLTGIAHPRYFVQHFKQFPFKKKVMHYPDHHKFQRSDIERIESTFKGMKGKHKIIVTTEKDAVRLAGNPYFPHHLKPLIFYLPITVNVQEGLKGSDLIPNLIKRIEERDNPLNTIYGDGKEERKTKPGLNTLLKKRIVPDDEEYSDGDDPYGRDDA